MGELFVGLGAFGGTILAAVCLLLIIAPLGIWSTTSRTNQLLEEQNIRIKHLTDHIIEIQTKLTQFQKVPFEPIDKKSSLVAAVRRSSNDSDYEKS